MHLVRQFHSAAGIPIETTRSMVDNWAPGTHEIYSQFIPAFIDYCCESRTPLGSINDQTISVFLTTGERATWPSAKLATARSAISGALYAGRGVSYRTSPMLAVVSQSRRKGSPAPTPAYDTSYPFKPIDDLLLKEFTKYCRVHQDQNGNLTVDYHNYPDCELRNTTISMQHRVTMSREAELRGFNAADISRSRSLDDRSKTILEDTDCNAFEYRLSGTKNGTGAEKLSPWRQHHDPRALVVGPQLAACFALIPRLRELHRRRSTLPTQVKSSAKANKEQSKFGSGFYADSRLTTSGKTSDLAAGSFGTIMKNVLASAGTPKEFRAHSERGNAETLLVFAGFCPLSVAKVARHTVQTLKKSYMRSDADRLHVLNVALLRHYWWQRYHQLLEDKSPPPSCEPQLRISEALFCATMDPSAFNLSTAPVQQAVDTHASAVRSWFHGSMRTHAPTMSAGIA